MDWELYERYRSTLLLAGLLLVSSLFLAFQRTSPILHIRAFLVRFTLPPQRFLVQLKGSVPSPSETSPEPANPVGTSDTQGQTGPFLGEERRRVRSLTDENDRLRVILGLQERKWPKAIVCHVAGRDPQKWFQEIVLDKGQDAGLQMDAPVLAVIEGREALVGRIVEVSARVSKVMLLQDPLSEVAATVLGPNGEDGVVAGTNGHELLLKFLDRGSQVKLGDFVVTSGLGKTFPAGIAIGWVESLEPDPRQLFLQARLHPAAKSNQIRLVLVLVPPSESGRRP